MEDGAHPPEISISRTSTISNKVKQKQTWQDDKKANPQSAKPSPKINTYNSWNPYHQWKGPKHETWGSKYHGPDVGW